MYSWIRVADERVAAVDGDDNDDDDGEGHDVDFDAKMRAKLMQKRGVKEAAVSKTKAEHADDDPEPLDPIEAMRQVRE